MAAIHGGVAFMGWRSHSKGARIFWIALRSPTLEGAVGLVPASRGRPVAGRSGICSFARRVSVASIAYFPSRRPRRPQLPEATQAAWKLGRPSRPVGSQSLTLRTIPVLSLLMAFARSSRHFNTLRRCGLCRAFRNASRCGRKGPFCPSGSPWRATPVRVGAGYGEDKLARRFVRCHACGERPKVQGRHSSHLQRPKTFTSL